MEHKIGSCYDIICARIKWNDDGREYDIPIFNLPHTDAQFNFPYLHYHIDGRFEMHPRMRHQLKIESGLTRSVILPEGTGTYDFMGLAAQNIRFERIDTGLLFPDHVEKSEALLAYEDWYKRYLGKKCRGRKCPHLGTEMLEKDGKMVCPLHGLTAENGTLKIISCI